MRVMCVCVCVMCVHLIWVYEKCALCVRERERVCV